MWKFNLYNNGASVLLVSEQILSNIKQEYKRLQKRRHLDSVFQQADGGSPVDLQNTQSGFAQAGNSQWQTLETGDFSPAYNFLIIYLFLHSEPPNHVSMHCGDFELQPPEDID